MILVDTSVWIDHFRAGVFELAELLDDNRVLMHPFILGELACGSLAARRNTLRLLANLPGVPRASDSEALAFIEARRLMGSGLGYLDAHLLASVILAADAKLWTRDQRLGQAAMRLGVAYPARALSQ